VHKCIHTYLHTYINTYVLKYINIYNSTLLIRLMVIGIDNYPHKFSSSGKFVENSTKLTYLKITGYRTKYSTVMAYRTANQAWSKGLDAGTYCE
jgi:hypothetical protein